MEEWKEYKIGDITKTNTSQYSLSEGWETIQYLDTGSITKNQISSIEKFFGNTDLPSRARRKVKHGDIVYSCVRPNLCHYGYIDNPPTNLLVSTGFAVITVNPNLADARYIYYYLTQNHIVQSLHTIGEQAVSTYPSIKASDIEDLSISLPSLPIQHKIASILKSLDDKIDVNRKINENLEQQAQALFKSWFVDFEPFKNGEFVESELGMIPKGWRVGKLGELCVTNKRTYKGEFNVKIKYIDTGSVTNNFIESSQILDPTCDKIPSRAKRAVVEGDIIYSSVRPNQKHYALLFSPSANTVVSTGFIVITSNWSAYRYFIYEFLIQDGVIDNLQAIAEQSVSTFPSINASDITNLKVVIPPNEIVVQYASIAFSHYNKINNNQQNTRRLAELRDTLIPKLMSGELKVNAIVA